MKIFYKISPDFQLGHLYEHIFLNQFTNSLRNAGFLAFLDYQIYGESYNDGVIKIYFKPFDDKVSDFFDSQFSDFNVKLSSSEIETAISQICCEKRWSFAGFPSAGETMRQISKLNNENWTEFDSGSKPNESIKPESEYIDFIEKDHFDKYKFSISITKKVDSRVFFLLSKIIINSASEDIEYAEGCFTDGVNEHSTPEKHCSSVSFISDYEIKSFDASIILSLITSRIDDVLDMFLLANIKTTKREVLKIISLMNFSIEKIEK